MRSYGSAWSLGRRAAYSAASSSNGKGKAPSFWAERLQIVPVAQARGDIVDRHRDRTNPILNKRNGRAVLGLPLVGEDLCSAASKRREFGAGARNLIRSLALPVSSAADGAATTTTPASSRPA